MDFRFRHLQPTITPFEHRESTKAARTTQEPSRAERRGNDHVILVDDRNVFGHSGLAVTSGVHARPARLSPGTSRNRTSNGQRNTLTRPSLHDEAK